MFALASRGAKVLQTRSVDMAMHYRMPVHVWSGDDEGGVRGRMESPTVTAIACYVARVVRSLHTAHGLDAA